MDRTSQKKHLQARRPYLHPQHRAMLIVLGCPLPAAWSAASARNAALLGDDVEAVRSRQELPARGAHEAVIIAAPACKHDLSISRYLI